MNAPRISAVYAINDLTDGKFYIGSSIDVFFRMRRHHLELERGKHANARLQRAWLKHGAGTFSFGICEECEPGALRSREQMYIDCLGGPDGEFLYNVHPRAGARYPQAGRRKSTEARMRMSIAHQKRFADDDGTLRAQMSAVRKGKPWTARQRAALSGPKPGRRWTEEKRRKMETAWERRRAAGLRKRGYKHTAEQRAAISARRRGQKATDRTRAILSAAHKASAKSRANSLAQLLKVNMHRAALRDLLKESEA